MIEVKKRSTIILKELDIKYQDDVENSKIDQYADTIGKYPYVQLGNTVIQTDDTIKITLYNNQFLPKVEVQFKDPTYRIIDPLFPIDNTILSLFIRSTSDKLMFIRMDFKITNINVDKTKDGDNQELIFIITGILNVDYLYYTPFKSYNDTSFNVLQTIANEARLGFATNTTNTEDMMVWINPGDTILDFIQDIMKYSYKSDETFMYSYIDFYYNLNYIDIEAAINEDITDQYGISSGVVKNKEDKIPLYLTDHPDKMSTNTYINKYNLINSSTAINLSIGYKTSVAYYDKNGNTYYKMIMDTISIQGTKGEQVILKGDINEITELAEQSWDNISLGRYDSDNVHPNFVYAQQHNLKNLESLQKIKMIISLNVMNFNLYRFQKINIKFYKLHEMNNNNSKLKEEDISNNKDLDEERLNNRLTGDWLITAINYTFNKTGGFIQEVTVVKRELGFNKEDNNK
jgi:hypothetical protein